MKKIVLTGPESTGKTTLAVALSKKYKSRFIPEIARDYLDRLDRPYHQKDLFEIAKLQIKLEQEALKIPGSLLFHDTDLLTIKIWSEIKYNECPAWIVDHLVVNVPDLYLVCGIDIPWRSDPQREHPQMRAELYQRYLNELLDLDATFSELRGSLNERINQAGSAIDSIIS